MEEQQHSRTAVLGTLGVLVILLTLYVVGYFAFSVLHPGPAPSMHCRVFKSQWLMVIYKPAAKCESAITGDSVVTYWMPDASP